MAVIHFISLLNTVSKSAALFLKYNVSSNKELQQKLMPKFAFGCKRALVHDTYYSTMAKSHVKLHTGRILSVTDETIVDVNGISPKIDVSIVLRAK